MAGRSRSPERPIAGGGVLERASTSKKVSSEVAKWICTLTRSLVTEQHVAWFNDTHLSEITDILAENEEHVVIIRTSIAACKDEVPEFNALKPALEAYRTLSKEIRDAACFASLPDS